MSHPTDISLAAARGCDGMIFDFVQDLMAAGVVSIPETGQTVRGGEILLKQ